MPVTDLVNKPPTAIEVNLDPALFPGMPDDVWADLADDVALRWCVICLPRQFGHRPIGWFSRGVVRRLMARGTPHLSVATRSSFDDLAGLVLERRPQWRGRALFAWATAVLGDPLAVPRTTMLTLARRQGEGMAPPHARTASVSLVRQLRAEFAIEPGKRPRFVDPDQVAHVAQRLGACGYRPLGKGRPGERRPLMPMLSEIFGLPARSLQRVLARQWPQRRGMRFRDRFRVLPS